MFERFLRPVGSKRQSRAPVNRESGVSQKGIYPPALRPSPDGRGTLNVENIKQGYIVDLGVLGKLYPAVNGRWDTDAENLSLQDMKPKVNYKAGDDIAAAIRGAQLSWTTEAETDENTVTDDDQGTTTGGDDNGGGAGGGGGNGNGELEE